MFKGDPTLEDVKKAKLKRIEKKEADFISDYKITELRGNKLIVKEIELKRGLVEEGTSGILITRNFEDGEKREERVGQIYKVGGGLKHEFKEGEHILYFEFDGWDLVQEGEPLRMVKADSIIAKIEVFKSQGFEVFKGFETPLLEDKKVQ